MLGRPTLTAFAHLLDLLLLPHQQQVLQIILLKRVLPLRDLRVYCHVLSLLASSNTDIRLTQALLERLPLVERVWVLTLRQRTNGLAIVTAFELLLRWRGVEHVHLNLLTGLWLLPRRGMSR